MKDPFPAIGKAIAHGAKEIAAHDDAILTIAAALDVPGAPQLKAIKDLIEGSATMGEREKGAALAHLDAIATFPIPVPVADPPAIEAASAPASGPATDSDDDGKAIYQSKRFLALAGNVVTDLLVFFNLPPDLALHVSLLVTAGISFYVWMETTRPSTKSGR